MDPPQPQPPFLPLPTSTIPAPAVPSAVQNAAPTISSAQIITEVPQNHVANAAPPPAQPLNHPSYTDMIYAAITALKERDGSSKRAIAKYIERAFTGLPATHSALLTHHLKRLKNTGLLVMVKKSYKLPRSDSTYDNIDDTTAAAPPPTTNPHPDASAALPAVSASSPSGPKRGRGRPPKPKPNSSQTDLISSSQPNAVPPLNSQSVMVPVGLSISTQPNIAPLFTDPAISAPPPPPPGNNLPNSAPASHLQMLGKRRPGRPKKAPGQPGALSVVVSSGKKRGRPPKSVSLGVKKSPGRPRKPKSVAANGVKKNPKRLPKSVVVPYATGAAVLNVPRPRGRPRKGEVLTAPTGGALGVPAKRPGRPPKVAGIVQPKMGARPVGRPKKNANVSWAQSQSQADAYGDLKRKFEIFQSRVKQAVSLLRPTLNSETAITAIAAIQDLEEIATLDLNAPFREEAPLSQLPQAQPQAQAQAQAPPQAAVTQN